MELVVWKVTGEDTFNHTEIARIKQNRLTMQHAFALSKDYAIVFEPPWYMMPNFEDLFTKNVQLLDLIANDEHGTTKIHCVRLSDGKTTTIDTKMWIMMLHFGNAYQPDENTIVLEGPAYTKADGDPYTIYMHDYLQSIEGITSHKLGNVYTRFTLNLEKQTMEREDLLSSEYGSYDLPQYNHKLEGTGRNRYTFLFHQFWQTTIDETYKWPIVKYDAD